MKQIFICEVGSFVPPKLMPAMTGTGAHKVTFPVSASRAQVKRLFSKVRKEIGGKLEAAHLHNTRGLGLANALAAYEEGVRHFDSSMAGLPKGFRAAA